MNETRLIEMRLEEKRKLAAAIDEFATDMKARAFQKVDEGYVGWDEPNDWSSITPETRLRVEAEHLMGPLDPARHDRKCVDAGMFAMFARITRRKLQES